MQCEVTHAILAPCFLSEPAYYASVFCCHWPRTSIHCKNIIKQIIACLLALSCSQLLGLPVFTPRFPSHGATTPGACILGTGSPPSSRTLYGPLHPAPWRCNNAPSGPCQHHPIRPGNRNWRPTNSCASPRCLSDPSRSVPDPPEAPPKPKLVTRGAHEPRRRRPDRDRRCATQNSAFSKLIKTHRKLIGNSSETHRTITDHFNLIL